VQLNDSNVVTLIL